MKNKFKGINLSEYKLLIFAFIAIFIYYLPYFILGENANITIHDNLDSNVTWVKILIDNNALFESPQKNIPTALNGLHVFNVYPYYDLSLVVFNVFGIYWGYVINKLLISVIGFLGMYLLLKRHFLPNLYSPILLVGISLIYGLLPFWSFSATVSGIPFVFFAFLNIRQKNYRFHNWLIIILFAFYSSVVLSGIFIIITIAFIFLYDTLKTRKINWSFITGLSLLVGAYLVSQFPIISGFFEGGISHREEFFIPSNITGSTPAIKSTLNILTKGQYHAHSLHQFIFLPILILLFYTNKLSKRIKFLVAFIVLTSVLYGFINYHYSKPIIGLITDLIPIQLQRFHFLHPMLWYILFAVTLTSFALKNRNGKLIAQFILIFQIIYVLLHHEIIINRNMPTFKEFYSEATFLKIKQIIDKPLETYKVISIGIHPAIAQYNGFYTLDGYFTQYPLSYKHQFRKVIENEIERSKEIKSYFDNWGSRCYAFSSEIGRDYVSNRKKPIDSLNYNFELLKELGCSYVFSASPINESINHKLKLIDSVIDHKSYWKLYVYEIEITQHNNK